MAVDSYCIYIVERDDQLGDNKLQGVFGVKASGRSNDNKGSNKVPLQTCVK